MTPVDLEEQKLRQAAARGDFAAAQAAAVRFARLLTSTLAELPPADALERVRRACELTDEARRGLSAARERIAEEMRRLEGLRHYHAQLSATEPRPNYRLRVQG